MTLLYKKIRHMLSLCDVFFKSSLSFLVPQHLFNIMNLFSALKKKINNSYYFLHETIFLFAN